ncbi:MAG: lysine exporter LysO family protein [Bacteroidales bacterium]|nr:lysine exporter LysO family protein [Bacteroidales bacterium]MCF8389240.1 lysine exporter LysO family protein [Bacteroidales bacterium]
MKASLAIAFFFVLGILMGQVNLDWENLYIPDLMQYTLYLLMLFVGLSFGSDPRIRDILKSAKPRMLLIPLTTIVGTFAGIALYNLLFSEIAPADAFAIGAGFGYYSLSSILIAEFSGSEIAIIALLSNVIRELLTLIFAPQIAKYFGKIAPIASGGATSMDTTLPVIVRVSGKEYLIMSLLNGIILTISVPFIISFIYNTF